MRAPRWRLYALAGAFLSLGAPLGLFLVQLARSGSLGLASLAAQLTHESPAYLYVFLSTLFVFAAFGAVLGRQADRLASLSGEDPLTGLLNAVGFHERLIRDLALADRYQLPLSLIVIEIEPAGERTRRQRPEAYRSTLRGVASALRAGSRGPDVAARLADFRFGLLAPCTDASASASLVERLQLLLPSSAGEAPVAVHLGVATVGPGSVGTPHGLMDAAISALEGGRRRGGNSANSPAVAPPRPPVQGPGSPQGNG